MNIYRSGVVAFGATPTYLVQAENLRVDPGLEILRNYSGVSVHPTFAGTAAATPLATFESRAIGTALGVIGVSGAILDPVVLYFPQLARTAGFAAGAVHTSITLDDCICVLQTITADQGGEAVATFEVRPRYDGSNVPVTVNKAATLPTVTLAVQKYTLGPMKIGATTYDLQSATLNMGINLESQAKNGDIYPSWNGIMSTEPTFDISTADLTLLDDFGCDADNAPVGTKASAVELWLRGLTNQGAPAADTDAKHIKLAVAQCYLQPTETAGGTTTVATQGFTGHIIFDGTNAPVVVTIDAAITTVP